jgi:transposase
MNIRTLGLDLGKTSFHAVGFDAQGHVVVRRRFSRPQLMRFVATLPPCLIGMEACGGAHHLGRAFQAHGHDVRLMPPQYVRPFVKAQKNDYLDAEAIGEAVQRPTMRFVPLKTVDQLDLQALHRVRDRLVARRTGVINQLRAFLLERGLTPRTGRQHLARILPELLAEAGDALSPAMELIIERLRGEWRLLEDSIHDLTRQITAIARADAACQRRSRFRDSGRSARRPSSQPSVRERRFARVVIWPRGLASFRCRRRREANRRSSASANAAMAIYDDAAARCTIRPPLGESIASRISRLAGRAGCPRAPERRGRRPGEQAGAHCLGRADTGRTLSRPPPLGGVAA